MKIRTFIVIPVLFLLVSCKDEITSSKEIIFDTANISELLIEELNNFWQGDSVWSAEYPPAFFKYYKGFIKNLKYESETQKVIELNVFKSQQIAIEAMEAFRPLISAITFEGDQKEIFSEKWWYIRGESYRSIWVNKYNTILFVSNLSSEDDNITVNTAQEIMDRIERLSK